MLRAQGCARAAQPKLSTAHSIALRCSPNMGINQNAVMSTPKTAPKVLPAYTVAIRTERNSTCESSRSIAGNVPPIAMVAGASSSDVPTKATSPWRRSDGCGPMSASRAGAMRGNKNARTMLQMPMTASQPAYHRAGCELRSMRSPNANDPSAMPPKNAASDCKYCSSFVSKPQSALLSPDDLIAEPGKTGGDDDRKCESMRHAAIIGPTVHRLDGGGRAHANR